MSSSNQSDFFVSYTGADRAWAEWISWQLEAAGFSVIVQAWHFGAGQDFVHEMEEGSKRARRMIAVISEAYARSKFAEAEWRSVFVRDPDGALGALIPVRVSEYRPEGLLASRIYVDLYGIDEGLAASRLVTQVSSSSGRPTVAPTFPPHLAARAAIPSFPGASPAPARAADKHAAESSETPYRQRLAASDTELRARLIDIGYEMSTRSAAVYRHPARPDIRIHVGTQNVRIQKGGPNQWISHRWFRIVDSLPGAVDVARRLLDFPPVD